MRRERPPCLTLVGVGFSCQGDLPPVLRLDESAPGLYVAPARIAGASGCDLAFDAGEGRLDVRDQRCQVALGLADLVYRGRERPVNGRLRPQRLPSAVDQGADPVEVDGVGVGRQLATDDPPRPGD